MKKRLLNWKKEEAGVMIVEATYVFPIVVLVVFLMIYVGNAYLQKCKVEAIVTEEIIRGAAYCGDPITASLESGGGANVEIQPYRFLIGGMDDLESDIEKKISNRVEKESKGLFKNMLVENIVPKVSFNNKFIYSTLSADVTYQIKLPIRMIGQEDPTIMDFSVRVDVPVSDSVELIRNIDMIEDYLQQWKEYNKAVEKITNMVDTLKEKMGI